MDRSTYIATVVAVAVAALLVAVELLLARRWDRHMLISRMVEELSVLVPQFAAGLSVASGTSKANPNTPEFVDLQSRIFARVSSVRVLARWPLRHAPTIRNEAEILFARLAAALERYDQRNPLTAQEAILGFDLLKLRHELYGKQGTLEKEIEFYLRSGFLGGDPPWRRMG